jgi:hypothetical protein
MRGDLQQIDIYKWLDMIEAVMLTTLSYPPSMGTSAVPLPLVKEALRSVLSF